MALELDFEAEIISWRGPAPFQFAPLPKRAAEQVRGIARSVSYGWGVIPVTATIADVRFTTSLFPRDGTYLLPIKLEARRKAGITVGDVVSVRLTVGG